VFPHLGIDVARINAARDIEGTFNVCNFSRKTNRVVGHREVTADLLVAGISLPMLMPPVRVEGDDYLDAVWLRDANLMAAVERGAEEIWVIWCIGNSRRYRGGAFHQYVHMIEMAANGRLFEELAGIAALNQRIARGDSPFGQRGPIRVKIVKPDYPLPLDPSYYLGQIDGATLVNLGYADAHRRLTARAEDDPLDERATAMSDPRDAVAFHEHFVGSLGDSPTAWRGKVELHTSVFVQELPRFLANPARSESLTGSLVVVGQEQPVPLGAGSFTCSPAPAAVASGPGGGGRRRHRYQAAFRYQGAPHFLVAERSFGVPASASAASELTTLRLDIHAGPDERAPVVATTNLRAWASLRNLGRSLQAVEPISPGDRLELPARFGRFLFRELYDAYLGPRPPWWKLWSRPWRRFHADG
jgi:hypothetical protein